MGNQLRWHGPITISSRSYVCGYCANQVASATGYPSVDRPREVAIAICPHCDKPTFFLADAQTPGAMPGDDVAALPADVHALYEEARRAIAANAPTAAVLICRKMLAHVAVSVGARPNQTFQAYVEHLADTNYVPPNGKAWVDYIRSKSNEANHEIVLMTTTDANELLTFVEMLLRFVYEFAERFPKK